MIGFTEVPLPRPNNESDMGDLQQLVSTSGPQQLSAGMHILLVFTVMALAPALLVLTTSFTRIIIVLGFLRQALGTPTTPPNMVLIPLAFFLTLLSMDPVLNQVYTKAWEPAFGGKMGPVEAYQAAAGPLRGFMLANTRRKDLRVLMEAARMEPAKSTDQVPDKLLIPAFALSELRASFLMGFAIFVTFLAVDMVIAGLLISLGMFMVPPMTISLPAKLILFVMADGWSLVCKSLIGSFHMAP